MKTLHDATLKLDHLLVHFSMKEKYASVLPNLAKNHFFLLENYAIMDLTIFYLIKFVSVIIDGATTIISTTDSTNGLWYLDLTPNGTLLPAIDGNYLVITLFLMW